MMKRIFSLLLALCLIVGLLPAVAMPHAHAEEGAALENSYTLKFHHSTYTLSMYDTPIYFVNEAFEEYDAAETQVKRTFYRPTTTGAGAGNWNAKLIWHTGDEGPTLYLNGFRYDEYDNEAGTWKGTEGKGTTVSTTTGITGAATAPLTIVLTGENSTIETALIGIYFQNDLTVLSEGNTKLVMNGYHSGFYSDYSGADLTVNANIDVSVQAEWNTSRTPMSLTNGNITINGGNVNLISPVARLSPIKINAVTGDTNGGVVAINGGYVTVTGGNVAVDVPAGGSVQVNAGTIDIAGGSQNLTVGGSATLPTVPENACVVVTYRYWASYNPVTVNGMPTSIARAAHIKIAHHANRTEVAAVAPDCVNDGTIQHWTCDKCGANFAAADSWTELESIVDPSIGEHAAGEIVKENEVAAGCENDGSYDAVTYCTGCGIEMSRTTVDVAHQGHTEVAVERVEPTTTKVGTTAGTKCAVCGIVLSGCEEIPMLKTAKIALMSWGGMSVTEGGTPVYRKTVSQQGYTSAGVENGLYWTYANGSATDWNIKFEYPMGGTPTLTLKDATLDHIGDDGTTLYTLQADGTYKSTGTLSAIINQSGYEHDLRVVLQGENHIEANNGIIRCSQSATSHMNNLTIVGEDGGSLTGTGKGIGISLHDGYDLTVENANIDIYTTSRGGNCIPFRTINGDITIIGSNITLSNTQNSAINAENSGNIVITDSVLNLEATFTGLSGAGAINACTSNNTSGGSITVTNSQITATSSNGAAITGFDGVVINGGSVSGNVRYGICTIEGDIKINGGEIEITASEKAFNGKTPDLSGYENWAAVAGTSKDTAETVTDADALTSAKYVKITQGADEPACEHTNTTTTEEVTKDATCTEAGSKIVTVTCECGEVISTETVEIAALGHTEETVAGKAATCTEAGLTDGTVCSVCGETVVAQTEIPALGHTAGAAVKENEVEADLNNEGSYDSVVYCDLCGAEMSRETVETPVKEGAVAEAGGLKYATLTEAIAAGGEVTLLDNITANALYKITAGQDVILNLNTKTITAVDGRLFIISVEVGGKLTINGEGGIINNNAYGYAIVNKGELIVNGGDIVGDYALYNGDFALTAKATLNGGTFSANEGAFYSVANCSELIVNGATLNDWVNTSAKFTVESGKIENLYVGVADKAVASGVATAINGGEIAALYAADTEKSPVTKGEGVTIEAPEGYCWNAENVLGEHAHTAVVTEATCTEAGFTTYTCAHCGDTYTADEVAALGHTEEVIPGKAATCTEAGLTEGKKCTVCGETTVEQEEIPATGHVNTTETVTIVDATCTAAGSKTTTVTCACGEVVSTTTEEIPVLPHTEEIIPGKEASCTEPGLTEGKKCSVCGEILVAQEEIAALGHSYADDAATECAVCGAARATVTVVDDEVTVNTNGMTGVKVHVFNITDKEIADIDVWNDLKAADPDFKTYTKNPFALAKGTYVLRVQYDDADGVMQAVSYQVTIDYTPAAVTPPTIEIDGNAVSVNNNGLTGVVVHAFNVTGKEVADIDVWNDLKAADPAFKTYTKNAFVLENGDYVLRVQYSNADGDKLTESHAVSINYTPGEPTATVGGKTVTVEGENVEKVHVFYVGGQEIADIDDWYQLKAADSTFKSYRKKQFAVKHSGKYVLRVEYADEHGVARKASLTITVA